MADYGVSKRRMIVLAGIMCVGGGCSSTPMSGAPVTGPLPGDESLNCRELVEEMLLQRHRLKSAEGDAYIRAKSRRETLVQHYHAMGCNSHDYWLE